MKLGTVLISSWAVVAWATGASAQRPDGQQQPATSYTLGPGKIEVVISTGFHRIEWRGTDMNGVPDVGYSPGGDGFIGTGLGIGITPHFSAQIGLSVTWYESDMYWRPEEPHDPYLANATLFTFTGGIRYDIRNPRYRVRPYAGGGLAAARFTNIKRGPSEWCSTSSATGACLQMAPELFTGTRLSGYFDGGVNFFPNGRCGIALGMKMFRMRGSGTAPAIPLDLPTGKDNFWHYELYAAVALRVR